jgi:hypothetical protein
MPNGAASRRAKTHRDWRLEMAMQNLISSSLSAEAKETVLKSISEIVRLLDFRTSMKAEEVRSLFKAGKEYAPFLDKAFAAMNQHPEIVPGVFPAEEFKKDYLLFKDLEPISSQIEQLAESIQKTMIVLASDTMGEALEIYHSAKQNAAHVPGLDTLVADMAVYFAKPRRTGSAAKGASGGGSS